MRALVIEDDSRIAQAIAKTLRAEGYAVDIAPDGIPGKEMATVFAPPSQLRRAMRFLRSVVLLTALLGPSALGQHALTLHDCLSIALAHHPALVTADLSFRQALLLREELSTAGRPTISLEGDAFYAPTNGSFGYDPAISNGGEVSGRVLLQESLYDGGARGLKGTQLDLEIRRLAIGRRAVERDLIAGVKDAFVTLLQAHEQAKLEGASLEEISGYLDLVMRRARSGIVSKSDILRTEIQRNAARAAADKAYADELAARLLLERAMGIAADTSFAVAGSLKGEEWQVPDSLMQETPDSSFATLDLAMAALQADQSRLDADISRAERHPAIALSADAGMLSSVDNLRLPRQNRSPFVGASVGMTIGIPVFTWGAIGLRVEQKALAAEIQDVRVHQLARSVESERLRVLIAIRSGRRLSVSCEANVRLAEDNYLLTKSRYAGGDALSLEVLTAQQAVTDTRLAALQAEVDCARAATVLEQLLDHE